MRQKYQNIINWVLKAAAKARLLGIPNLLQPGLVKEMIIANLLGHELIHSKRDADAHALGNPNEKYEYLSCKEGGSGQLNRMFKEPPEKHLASLHRIRRNAKIYFSVFYKANQTKCKVIYEIDVDSAVIETQHQLDASRNAISHISFPIRWAQNNGKIVYKDT